MFKFLAKDIKLESGKSVEEAIGGVSVVDITAVAEAGGKIKFTVKMSDGTTKNLAITMIP